MSIQHYFERFIIFKFYYFENFSHLTNFSIDKFHYSKHWRQVLLIHLTRLIKCIELANIQIFKTSHLWPTKKLKRCKNFFDMSKVYYLSLYWAYCKDSAVLLLVLAGNELLDVRARQLLLKARLPVAVNKGRRVKHRRRPEFVQYFCIHDQVQKILVPLTVALNYKVLVSSFHWCVFKVQVHILSSKQRRFSLSSEL